MNEEFTPQSIYEDYRNYLVKVPTGIKYLIEAFRENHIQEGLDSLKDFSEALTWLVNAAEYLKASEFEIEFDISKVITRLEEINEALKYQDFLLVADILEYELYEYFNDLIKN